MDWVRAITLLIILVYVHELGHITMYILTTGYVPTISLAFLPDPAIAVNYPVVSPMPLLVTAGGLVILLPFLLFWPKTDILDRMVILGMALYAGLEVLLRL